MKHATTGKNTQNTMVDDLDIPPLTNEQLNKMRPLQEVQPDIHEALTRGKTRITIMLDNDVLAAFRERAEKEGHGYQTLINEALKAYLTDRNTPLTRR